MNNKGLSELTKLMNMLYDFDRQNRKCWWSSLDDASDSDFSRIRKLISEINGILQVMYDRYSKEVDEAEKKAYDEVFMSANRNRESFKVFSGIMVNK